MVLHLAEHLDVPLRERNALLLAAGFAPALPRAPSSTRPSCSPVRDAIERVLVGARAVPGDRRRPAMGLVAANAAAVVLIDGVDARTARAARQRTARQPAPGRPGATHREPRRVGREHHRRIAPPDRGDRRRRSARARRRAVRVRRGTRRGADRRRTKRPARSRSRCGCGPTTASSRSSRRSPLSAPRST